MKLAVKLTLEGMIRALRWRGMDMAESAPDRPVSGDPFVPLGEAARAVVDKAMHKGGSHGQ